jgi:hypothetical protein
MSAAAATTTTRPYDRIVHLYDCVNCRASMEHFGPEPYLHKCEDCGLALCRPCDDRSNILCWYSVKDEEKYLCAPCAKKNGGTL